MTTLFLVHGGLWEPMNADRFWRTPGVLAGLEKLGFEVLAPDRLQVPDHWSQEVEHLALLFRAQPVVLVGASNGCSVAARLALAYPESRCLGGRRQRVTRRLIGEQSKGCGGAAPTMQ
jgi:pimeloyl-ACP methyl ester carboxylesterase